MLKKIFLSIGFILSTYTIIFAEPIIQQAVIKGTVLDAESGIPLIGANVMVTHTTIGTATDVNGRFMLSRVPVAKQSITVSMMGYQSFRKDLHFSDGDKLELTIKLKKTLLEIGSVVVTGTGTPHTLQDAPVKTKLITRLDIEQRKVVNVAEALDFQPGINVENNCQNCNFSQVRIMGMDGKYSQILIDSDPVVSSLAGIYGLEHYPAEMLDKIEVIKGGGSALYGGGAVAGVINMVTRRPVVKQSRIKYNHGVTNGGTNDIHLGITSEMVNNTGKSGAYLFASTRQREEYDRNEDSFSELGQLKNESLGFNWYYTPIQDGEFSAHFHRVHEFRRGGDKFDLPNHDADISESLEHWKYGGTAKWKHQISPLFDYKIFYSFSLTDRKSYYGGLGGGRTRSDSLSAKNAYGYSENPLQTMGITGNYLLFGNHLLTTGIQHSADKIIDNTVSNEKFNIDENYTNTGFFIQDNLHFGEHEELEFVIGARFDKHSELDKLIISPRFNFKYEFIENTVFRAGLSTGFKAPQVYDEDLHIAVLGGDEQVVRNAKNLKEEISNSLNAGLDYNGYIGDLGLMASVTGYYTTINDVFTKKYIKNDNNVFYYERINGEGATIKGFEIEIGLQPNSRIQLLSGFTYSKGQYEKELDDWDTKNFLRTPKISGNIGLSITLTKDISLQANAKYMGEADVPHEIIIEGKEKPDRVLETGDDYIFSNIFLNYQLSFFQDFNARISFGIKNITDAYQDDLDSGPQRDPAYLYGPSIPRTITAGLEINF